MDKAQIIHQDEDEWSLVTLLKLYSKLCELSRYRDNPSILLRENLPESSESHNDVEKLYEPEHDAKLVTYKL